MRTVISGASEGAMLFLEKVRQDHGDDYLIVFDDGTSVEVSVLIERMKKYLSSSRTGGWSEE